MLSPIIIATVLAAATTLLPQNSAQAQTVKWCAVTPAGTKCDYYTKEECEKSLQGLGGTCQQEKK